MYDLVLILFCQIYICICIPIFRQPQLAETTEVIQSKPKRFLFLGRKGKFVGDGLPAAAPNSAVRAPHRVIRRGLDVAHMSNHLLPVRLLLVIMLIAVAAPAASAGS